MAKNRQALSDEKIISAIMGYGSIRKAAVALQCSPRAIYNRWGSEAFQTAFRAAQMAILQQTVNKLSAHSLEAVETVAKIMNDNETNSAVRLSAARILLDNLSKLSTITIEQGEKIGEASGNVPWDSKYLNPVDDWGDRINDR